jgi:hypothetical protein
MPQTKIIKMEFIISKIITMDRKKED